MAPLKISRESLMAFYLPTTATVALGHEVHTFPLLRGHSLNSHLQVMICKADMQAGAHANAPPLF